MSFWNTAVGSIFSSGPRALGWSPNSSTPSTTASQTEADIQAGQLADWENIYKPIELQQLQQSSLNNPNILPEAVANAEQTATQSAQTTASEGQRLLASRGIKATPGQQVAMDRLNNLNTATTTAGAANQARQTVATQDELIALGTAPNPNVASKSLQ